MFCGRGKPHTQHTQTLVIHTLCSPVIPGESHITTWSNSAPSYFLNISLFLAVLGLRFRHLGSVVAVRAQLAGGMWDLSSLTRD